MDRVLVALIVIAIGALMVRSFARAFFYPIPSGMPEPDQVDIASALARFEAALGKYAPQVLAKLQPGLTQEQIREIESKHRLCLTEELRALYRWRNGTPRASLVTLIPGHTFLPLEEAAAMRDELRRQAAAAPVVQRLSYSLFAGHRATWITILDDLCGDGYFYDSGRRGLEGSFFYHFAEDRTYRYFPSVVNFLSGASEFYEAGIYRSNSKGEVSENVERAFALWPRYASWPGKT